MLNISKDLVALAVVGLIAIFALSMPFKQVNAADWLMLQGTEPNAAAGRATVWGLVQPEAQYTDGSVLQSGTFNGKPALFNMIGPDATSRASFQLRRARFGVRGQGFPLDGKTNYYILAELGNNSITAGSESAVKLADASVTFNQIPYARVRIGQFKYPGSEEGLQSAAQRDFINYTSGAEQLLLERFFDKTENNLDRNVPVGAFRDIGGQLFDTQKVADNWFASYAIMLGNGNGINRADNNADKDLYFYAAAEQIYAGKGSQVDSMKWFAWHQVGKRNLDGRKHNRSRTGLGATFRKTKYRAAFEYFFADGVIYNGTIDGGRPADGAGFSVLTANKASAFYVHAGFMLLPNVQLDLRYDDLKRSTESATDERRFSTLTAGIQYFVNKKTRVVFNYEKRHASAPGLTGEQAVRVNKILDVLDDRMSMQVVAAF